MSVATNPSDIPWGPTGLTVFRRTYSRVKEDGTRETWPETVTRVVDGNLALVYGDGLDREWPEEVWRERSRLIHYMEQFAILPAGRHLNATGVPGRQYLFNCHVAGWGEKLSEHFEFTALRLFEGGGVGANYSTKHIAKYGVPKSPVEVRITCRPDHEDIEELRSFLYHGDERLPGRTWCVGDSREGWAKAVTALIDTFMSGSFAGEKAIFWFDVSAVRPSGSPLVTSGGTASGPAPFAKMMLDIAKILNSARRSASLTPTHVMEMDHAIAEAVVAGGNRRSARMAIVHWNDPHIMDFLCCKRDTGKHWTTNISVEVDDDFFMALKDPTGHGSWARAVHREVVKGMLTNGEPGYWNSSRAQEGETGEVIATNPCGEIALEPWENCFDGDTEIITAAGPQKLRELTSRATTVWFDGDWHFAQGHSFGVQPVQEVTFAPARRSTGAGYQKTRADYRRRVTVTPDHRWDTQRGLVNDLSVGDVVQSSGASVEIDMDGFRHGLIFGDGSEHRPGTYRIRLYGAKRQYDDTKIFDHVTYPAKAGVPEGWLKSEINLKDLPSGSQEYLAGFLAGWIATDGTVKPNGSVVIGTTSELAVEWLERHAASLGWVVRGISKHDGPTNYGDRNAPLHYVTLAKGGEWVVESIEPLGEREVFCVTVPDVGQFTLGSGIETRNCNLGHVNLDAFVSPAIALGYDWEGLAEAHRLITRFLIRATYGDVNDDKQAAMLARNRRIGVGHLGVQGFWAKQGIRYSEIPSYDLGGMLSAKGLLRRLYHVVRKEARDYAFELRIPEPVKVTAVAPTGTVAKLPGVTEGIHPVYSRWFERRVRFSLRDPMQANQVLEAQEQGFKVETDEYDSSGKTVVVVYPTEDILVQQVRELGLPEGLVESADEISVEAMLQVQRLYQEYWADNAVSYTVNIPAGAVTADELAAILERFLPMLKGTTVMVDESRPQAPYTRITRDQYEAATARRVEDGTDEECASGACPVK